MRKELQLDIMERVSCIVEIKNKESRRLLHNLIEYIEEETRTNFQLMDKLELHGEYLVRNWKINDIEIRIALEKR